MSNARVLSTLPSAGVTFRNKIINGDMKVDQRNSGSSVTGNDGTFSVDRWQASCSPNGKFTLQQSSTAPAGFINSLVATSTSAYSVGSGDFAAIRHNIEGLNVADLGWGTANAKTVTLSFWVQSSLTGTFGGSLTNNAINRSYPFTYSIPTANTWTQISVTVVGDTTGTWLTTNGRGICLFFNLGAGSTYSGTAGAWAGAAYTSATGAQSVVGTNGATFYITGVQLEKGSVATPYEVLSYETQFAQCQRYYEKSDMVWIWAGYVVGGNANFLAVPYKVTKRANATNAVTFSAGTNFTLPIIVNNYGTDGLVCYMVGASNGFGYYQFTWSASAEL